MTIYFCADPIGFFDDRIEGQNIPENCIVITPQEHGELFSAQSRGEQIIVGSDGKPTTVPRPVYVAPRQPPLKQEYSRLCLVLPDGLEQMWSVMNFDTSLLPTETKDVISRKNEIRAELAALISQNIE